MFRRREGIFAWYEYTFREIREYEENMNKYLMITSFAVITTNICGIPLDGNNLKRSLNLSEISENIGNPNKKAKPNKNIIEVNENNRKKITNAFEVALRNAEDKKRE